MKSCKPYTYSGRPLEGIEKGTMAHYTELRYQRTPGETSHSKALRDVWPKAQLKARYCELALRLLPYIKLIEERLMSRTIEKYMIRLLL